MPTPAVLRRPGPADPRRGPRRLRHLVVPPPPAPASDCRREGRWDRLRAAAARAGLPATVSLHWLRHAHVSHALDRGAPAHLVQATVGHASLTTTSRYAHARPNDSSARYLAV